MRRFVLALALVGACVEPALATDTWTQLVSSGGCTASTECLLDICPDGATVVSIEDALDLGVGSNELKILTSGSSSTWSPTGTNDSNNPTASLLACDGTDVYVGGGQAAVNQLGFLWASPISGESWSTIYAEGAAGFPYHYAGRPVERSGTIMRFRWSQSGGGTEYLVIQAPDTTAVFRDETGGTSLTANETTGCASASAYAAFSIGATDEIAYAVGANVSDLSTITITAQWDTGGESIANNPGGNRAHAAFCLEAEEFAGFPYYDSSGSTTSWWGFDITDGSEPVQIADTSGKWFGACHLDFDGADKVWVLKSDGSAATLSVSASTITGDSDGNLGSCTVSGMAERCGDTDCMCAVSCTSGAVYVAGALSASAANPVAPSPMGLPRPAFAGPFGLPGGELF